MKPEHRMKWLAKALQKCFVPGASRVAQPRVTECAAQHGAHNSLGLLRPRRQSGKDRHLRHYDPCQNLSPVQLAVRLRSGEGIHLHQYVIEQIEALACDSVCKCACHTGLGMLSLGRRSSPSTALASWGQRCIAWSATKTSREWA